MALSRVGLFVAVALLGRLTDLGSQGGVAIDHTPVDCVVAGRLPAFAACFMPAEEVVRARIYYRLGQRPWQYSPLLPEGSCFGATLPRPRRGDDALRYYVEVVDNRKGTARSSEHRARVVADSESCGGGVVAQERESLQAGSSKNRRGLLTVMAVGAGVAGAAVALAGAASGTTPDTSVSVTTAATTAPQATAAPTTSAPTTSQPGAPTTTPGPSPTTSTLPAPSTTAPGTTTTTIPASTTTTTTTTTPTTTTLLCAYAASPPATVFALLGGSGSCAIAAAPACSWRAQSNAPWIVIQGGGFGTGSGSVAYEVQGLTLGQREGDIALLEDPSVRCHVIQRVLAVPAGETVRMTSELDVAGAAGQVVWNGVEVRYHSRGFSVGEARAAKGLNRIDAQLVTAAGRPGTWRFKLDGRYRAGSLRPIAGRAIASEPETIAFVLSGRAGERVVFAFETDP